jgi:hypothetical protein
MKFRRIKGISIILPSVKMKVWLMIYDFFATRKTNTYLFLRCILKQTVMRIRTILLGIFFLFTACTLHAQLKYGIRGGINSSNIATDSQYLKDLITNNEYLIDFNTGSLGFHIGGLLQINMSNFFIEPQLLYTSVNNDVKYVQRSWLPATDPDSFGQWQENEDLGRQKLSKVDLPVIFGYRFGPLRVVAGPVGTMIVNTKFVDLDAYNLAQNYKTATIGYQAGIGLELSSLVIDVKYEGNLSSIGDGITIGNKQYNFDQRMSQWILSVGFVFGDY